MKCLTVLTFIILPVLVLSQQNSNNYQGNLPDNFPVPEVLHSDEPSPGYFFVSPAGLWGHYPDATPYLVVLDNFGTPIFYQEQSRPAFDFKVQVDGSISYAQGTLGYKHYILDDKWQFIKETGAAGNSDDFHDFMILEDGNYLTLANEYRIIDMSEIVEGGHPEVTVIGGVIRIQEPNDNIVFEWNTFDHIPITDAADHIDLTDSLSIDYVHVNSVEMDSDTSIIISSRNLHEVTKFSVETGEIIWRLGGKQNQFTFQDDSCRFYAQHDARKTVDGYYSVFDNNWNISIEGESRAIIYDLDEINMTATVVNDYRSRPEPIMGWIMGNAQELDNGNWVAGWGSGVPNVTEFKHDGSKAFEIKFDAVNYRSFKFNWKPQAFTFSVEEADFDSVKVGESTSYKIFLTNNRLEDATINYIHHHDDRFSVLNQLPFLLPSGIPTEIELAIYPKEEGYFDDLFTFCWDTTINEMHQRIAAQINVKAKAINDLLIDEHWKYSIKIYPNPCKNYLIVDPSDFNGKILSYKLTDLSGKVLVEKQLTINQLSHLNLSRISSGIYLLELETDKGTLQRKFIKD